ncbi:MAG: hypothetical protein EA366_14515 [Spirulina sp. DLM2.Bin59]|nr:MAG: hypothetical protein EA366_14515 [Spirulina sp. DLM2.Bin59]
MLPIFLTIPPVAPPPPVTITTPAQIPPDQNRPPARSQVFHKYPEIAYLPACSQLVSRVEPDGVVYGVTMPDGTFNPLAITEPMPQHRAFLALNAMMVCKSSGDAVIVPITLKADADLRHSVLEVNAVIGAEPAKKGMGSLATVAGGVLIVAAGAMLLFSQRSHNQASEGRDRLKAILGGGDE